MKRGGAGIACKPYARTLPCSDSRTRTNVKENAVMAPS
jgi:hypothetical protein